MADFDPDRDDISRALAPVFAVVHDHASERALASALAILAGGQPEDIVSSTFFTGMLFGCLVGMTDMTSARILLDWGMELCGWTEPPPEFVEATDSISRAAILQATR